MPYAKRRTRTGWEVYNTESGSVKGRGMTRSNADAQLRLLRGVEHGLTPRKRRRK